MLLGDRVDRVAVRDALGFGGQGQGDLQVERVEAIVAGDVLPRLARGLPPAELVLECAWLGIGLTKLRVRFRVCRSRGQELGLVKGGEGWRVVD